MSSGQEVGNKTKIQDNSDLNVVEGRYIYGIIGTNQERKFTSPAIGARADTVYSISYQDIAAVISPSPIMKYSISRENTIAHQKVLEELIMDDLTILPVKFGTVASGKDGVCAEERIRKEVLKARYEELKELLIKMDNKIELGLKALWSNMKVIFGEIIEENKDIKILKERIASKSSLQTYGDRITLGEKVKDALERKKAKEQKDILDVLKEAYVDMRSNKIFGDNMITNLAFLVEKPRVEEFDRLVDRLSTIYDGRIKFKYVGPVPP
ncbi:MAG: GvpL/GvpF family gas vesicle protein, partial [Candidatus Edwardsbacteria bacterium]